MRDPINQVFPFAAGEVHKLALPWTVRHGPVEQDLLAGPESDVDFDLRHLGTSELVSRAE